MNRSNQLIQSLESCLLCNMPDDFEFVIIDNGSIDDTRKKVDEFIQQNSNIKIKYIFSEKNLGVGGGRSLGYNLSNGKILYFLDDDAVISPESREKFFVSSIKKFEEYSTIASITTKIYDECLKYDRNVELSSNKIAGLHCIFKYLGGSHFLRKSAFKSPLYFDIKYGSEEYAPSIIAQDKGYCHVYDDNLRIVHRPKINKWIDGTEEKKKILICGVAVVYATKRILYPTVFYPILFFGYKRRSALYLAKYPNAIQEANEMIKKLICENKLEKINFFTVIKLYCYFGATVF